jgi:alpha-mannosidase
MPPLKNKFTMTQFHLIANSHLDPVWLWDWREGLNEGIQTVRTVLDLMDEHQSLTYIRGESLIYRHIEENDPATFRRIVAQVESGRWDIVGGTYIQPDTNLAGVETLTRQFTEGKRYFLDRFGKNVEVAWQADSFGHSAGLPEILSAAGIHSFVFTRPNHEILPFREPAFWWEGASGARILAYRPLVGWYGTERDEVKRRMDGLLEASGKSGLENVGCFYGLGNHGGGPTRRQLAEIQAWAEAHPDVRVVHSGLHQFFSALRKELKGKPRLSLPVHRGELNFCLRGCYSSLAKFKSLYRRGQNLLMRAEKTDSAVSAFLGKTGTDLTEAWRGILLNSFHDILPGSSIERAVEDQTAWMGQIIHASQKVEFAALNQLAKQIDTRVADHPMHHPSGIAALVWNPYPTPFRGHVEMEAGLDYRPLWQYEGRHKEVPVRVLGPKGEALPFQEIATENRSVVKVPWRKRVLVPVSLPAFGWNVLELGWVEGSVPPEIQNPVKSGPGWIDNGIYRVEAVRGEKGIRIFHQGKALLAGEGLTASLFEDGWGSWGGMEEEKDSIHLNTLLETWTIKEVALLENGHERATLWVRYGGSHSRLDLTISVTRDREAVDVQARVFWAERSTRLKLNFPAGDRAEFEVPGATVKRPPCGEVPGGKWVKINSKFGFASDSLYNFSCLSNVFSATVIRGTRYADDVPTPAQAEPWLPATDLGEFRFRFLMTAKLDELPRLARELEQPPVVMLVPARKGKLPKSGSLAALEPAALQVLALKAAESGKGFVLRVQAPAGRALRARLIWMGRPIILGPVKGGKIVSWHLEKIRSGWRSTEVDSMEIPLRKKIVQQKEQTKKGSPS